MLATQDETKAEGMTTFHSPRTTSYRYLLSVKRDKLMIWLEDRSSKRQWQTTYMPKDNYVTAANAFVDATSAEYASLFQQSLDCSLDGSGDVQRKLTCLPDDAVRLEFCNTIRLLDSARSICYVFDLQSVAVDRIQILEAKMRDHQEALDQFGAGVDLRSLSPVHLYAESDVKLNVSKLKWTPVMNINFGVAKKKRNAIIAHVPGLYALAVVVSHVPRSQNGGAISLCINGVKIQRATTGDQTSTSLMCLARLEKESHIAVICTNIAPAKGVASHLTAVRIME
ncbi:hypothetical protein PF010_g24628 [Phytophthora fragariae]|uniref:Uncharacterized protein n=2 Tax=Phytophthora fragariae TaxID=53985 RepID=A0A6A3WU88_9STRA|nr:hypothetical protein PF009_g25903 [Phytophthora fragariae]KAE8976220.1 hypothetical protein PF011_g24143 [Phytophthora fragariae]KAE9073787.1 hypothetical protein PF007_g25674 [Phytophthora fragariae]KAE9074571.1 hypothetical protein PF010_g24628 [Phytophthora fragariae]KAE9093973.1 hypothetical protein PF006_g24322 [Phytophthora fragariae]